MPRSNDEFLNGTFKYNEDGQTHYVHGTGENALGTQSGSIVRVSNPHTSYEDPTNFRGNYLYGDDGQYQRDEEGNILRQSWEDRNQVKPGEQIPLYRVRHTPPVLDYMVSTKDAAPKGAALAAHAIEETRRRFGERPLASNSTSKFSTPMVNTAIKHGIIKGVNGREPGELTQSDNTYDWMNSISALNSMKDNASIINEALDSPTGTDRWNDRSYSKIPDDMLQFDKNSIAKEALHNIRGGNPRNTTSNYEQLPLPTSPFGHK
jgi:hypothetical protein